MTHVLLVDDDRELGAMLAEYFEAEGLTTKVVLDGESGIAEALGGAHDIVLVDVMLPRVNGIEMLRRVRASSRIPIMMLTARGDDIDRVLGLEFGADDYVPKPSSPRELVARIRAILRRSQAEQGGDASMVAVQTLKLWPGRRAAQFREHPLNLTGAEFNLLEVLMRNAGRLVSKTELSQQALGRPLARFDRSIDVHISSIRHKLTALSKDGGELIRTVRGMGYHLAKE